MTIDRRTLAEQVYENLRADILSGRLAPRSVLSEVALADSFGTSRGPVREAIRRLFAEGLLVERPRKGAVVASLSKEDFENAYQVRSGLEALAVTLGTPLATDEALGRIHRLIEEMDRLATDGIEEEFFVVNRKLHREFCALANNPILFDMYDRLMNTMERYSHRSAVVRGDLRSSVDEHRAIVDAIRQGDSDRAALLTREHVDIPLRKVKEMTEQEWEALL